jgi:hypothetical protein
VNAQSQFTLAGSAGEFRLYVHPYGLREKWRPSRSAGAKPQQMASPSALTVQLLKNAGTGNENIVNVGVDGVCISSEHIKLDRAVPF